jgi:hypothetical protein
MKGGKLRASVEPFLILHVAAIPERSPMAADEHDPDTSLKKQWQG